MIKVPRAEKSQVILGTVWINQMGVRALVQIIPSLALEPTVLIAETILMFAVSLKVEAVVLVGLQSVS